MRNVEFGAIQTLYRCFAVEVKIGKSDGPRYRPIHAGTEQRISRNSGEGLWEMTRRARGVRLADVAT